MTWKTSPGCEGLEVIEKGLYPHCVVHYHLSIHGEEGADGGREGERGEEKKFVVLAP